MRDANSTPHLVARVGGPVDQLDRRLQAGRYEDTDSRDDPYWHFKVSGDAPTPEEAALLAAMGRPAMNSATVRQGS
jgi:hypothetical protein